MIRSPRQFIVDANGRQVGVLLDIDEYHRLTELAEEVEDAKAYDAAKASGDQAVDFEQAIGEIEQERG